MVKGNEQGEMAVLKFAESCWETGVDIIVICIFEETNIFLWGAEGDLGSTGAS